MRISVLPIACSLVISTGVFFSSSAVFGEFSSWKEALPSSNRAGEIISHSGYILQYDERHEQADWVIYDLTAEHLKSRLPRDDNFRADPDVKTGSAELSDYKNSGYDRGHLAPAADMEWSKQAMSESFFLSNMSPQDREFNRGIWNTLEERVREWAKANDELYVVTGPVLRDGLPTIGKNQVSVPKQYYKVLLDYRKPDYKAIAFLLPNEASTQSIDTYAVTIDSVEAVTGIDFFPALPDSLERKLEGSLQPAEWGLSGPVRLAAAEAPAQVTPDTTTEPPLTGKNEPGRFTVQQIIMGMIALIIVVLIVWLLLVTLGEATGLFRRKR